MAFSNLVNRYTMANIHSLLVTLCSVLIFSPRVYALGATDTITWGGDVSRAGYQPNHNMDPAVVGSADFGQIFKTLLPGNFNGIGPEQIFSQPLVYTGADGIQYVYVATTQNNVYKLDAKTGAIIASRNLHVPFLTADLDGCVDINPTVGVTGTGVIDPDTGVWYFTAKTYAPQFQNTLFGPSTKPGRLNGRHYWHAINTVDLSEMPGFPVLTDGQLFRNNPNRMFIGGNQHQRTALLQVGNYIYAGYASHCVQYNYTGAVIGINKKTGAFVEVFATQRGPEPNTTPGGGVWMSGGGLAYDGKGSMYFATGNGYASQLAATGQPLNGYNPPSTLALEEAAVNAKINDDGTLSVVDFFMPWEKTQLDGADKDLGTSPLELLPTDTFSCPNHKRIGVVTGKSGKTYWLNLDDLGGYQTGANRLDRVIQVYQNENSVYAGAGVMPLGGGYIYINVIQYQTHIFKFSCDANGNAVFTKTSDTAEKNAYILGVGHGTTTSLNGQDGTGLLWTSDVEGQNLRIYNAIPPSPGANLTLIRGFNIPGVTKFTRPVFGNARVYMGTTLGYLYGFGSPVNLPLNCSSPYTFGKTALGSVSAPLTITCTANIATQITNLTLTGNPNFITNFPALPISLTAGQKFSFNASFAPKQVGPLSSDVIVGTTNGVTGYSSNTPISLKGTANSPSPLLSIVPNTMSFNVVVGQGTSAQYSSWSNAGDSDLSFTNISFSTKSETGPWFSGTQNADGSVVVGPFNFTGLPFNGIPANSAASVGISYNASAAGNDAVYIKAFSSGGNSLLDVFGVAGTNAVGLIEFEKFDGSGWTAYVPGVPFTFGTVTENTIRKLRMRITNNGTNSAVPLSLTVSKVPYGVPGIVGAVNGIDLAEGTLIAAGTNQTATLYCSPPKSQINGQPYTGSANWTINTSDPALGKVFLSINCTAVTEQMGPLYPNGTAQFGYVGCFGDNINGIRQMATRLYSDNNNTNDRCINSCAAAGWTFAATEYLSECWCGNAIPVTKNAETDCNFPCSGGNGTQTCGGNGFFRNSTEMSLFADSTKFNGNTTASPLAMVQSVGNYSYIGCWQEKNAKTFNTKSYSTQTMTVEFCASSCSGYTYFGLQFGQECYCGNNFASTSSLTSDSMCSMVCKGSNSEYCGAGSLMQAYQLNGVKPTYTSSAAATAAATTAASAATSAPASVPLTNYTYVGCYTETHDRRALNGLGRSVTYNTLEVCAAFCLGYEYFGVEYGAECYCGHTIYNNSVPATDPTQCNFKCPGNSNETCGGVDYLNIYYTNVTYSTTTTTAAAAAGNNNNNGGTAATPTPVASVGQYISLGCYNEVPGRALSNGGTTGSTISIESCAAYCAGYAYFGTEYGQECYCGKTLNQNSLQVFDGRCNMACAANSTEVCGGPNGISLYQLNGTLPSSSIPAGAAATTTSTTAAATPVGPTVVPSASGYVAQGCYNEKPNGRALPSLYANDSMTIEMCAGKAATAKVTWFGVQYGRECWYGNTLDSTSLPAAQSFCTMKCPGNTTELCGNGGYFQMYNISSTTSTTTSTSSLAATSSTSVAASSGTASSSAASAGSATASSSVSPSASSTASSVVASSSTSSSSSTSASATPNPSALSCPASNGTIYTEPVSGNNYTVECFWDRAGGDLAGTNGQYAPTLEACTARCANTTGCVDVSYVVGGGACYMKGSAGNPGTNNGVWGMRQIIPASTATSASVAATPTPSALSCPGSNGTVWTEPKTGDGYLVECYYDRNGGNLPGTNGQYAATLEACASRCSNTTSCIVVSYVVGGGACYMKSSAGNPVNYPNNGVYGMRKISSGASTSSSVSSSSVATSSSSSVAVSSTSSSASVSSSSNAGSTSTSVAASPSSSSSISPSSSASSSVSSSAPPSTSSSAAAGQTTSSSSISSSAVSSSSTISSSSSTSASPTPIVPTPLPSVSSYVYKGCYNETNGRTLASTATTNGTAMTPQMCASFCSGYAWFGVEYGQECYCGAYPRAGSGLVAESSCNMVCPGNNTLLCGSGNRLQMYYSNDTSKIYRDPAIVNTSGNYSFYNCTVDSGNPRPLAVVQASNSMSIDACMALAEAGKYSWAGVEYGRECWMGNTLTGNPANATKVTECSMACSGNGNQLCGAGSRLSLYKRNAGV